MTPVSRPDPAHPELVACPGCGKPMHQRALQCLNCGFRPDLADYQELLGSLGTISSILVGFGLAGVVTLATTESERLNRPLLYWVEGMWVLASFILLGVLVLGEFLRRTEPEDVLLVASSSAQDRYGTRCMWLLGGFIFALFAIALGLVLLAFNLHLLIGIVTILGLLGVMLFSWFWFSS